MIELTFNFIFILLLIVSIIFLAAGRKHEGMSDKKTLNFFLLGLIFFILYNLSFIFTYFALAPGVMVSSTILLSLLTALSFTLGVSTLKKEYP